MYMFTMYSKLESIPLYVYTYTVCTHVCTHVHHTYVYRGHTCTCLQCKLESIPLYVYGEAERE